MNNEKPECYTSLRIYNHADFLPALQDTELHDCEQCFESKRRCMYDGNLTSMNDAAIRAATKRALFLQHKDDVETVIFEELGVQHGASRIDLAVVNGELHGFELKSNRDTLTRLPEQIDTYGRVFDRVTLVVGEQHLRRAVEIIPDWWGIRVARTECGKMFLCDLRIALENPSPDAKCVAMLLWRHEALGFLEELGQAKGLRSRCRAEIYAALASSMDFDSLRHRVRTCLRQRSDWRSAATRLSCGG